MRFVEVDTPWGVSPRYSINQDYDLTLNALDRDSGRLAFYDS